MANTKTPAPRRAGTRLKARSSLKRSLAKLAHDEDALELLARLIEKLADRSPRPPR